MSHPNKEGPHVRGNGASTQDALEDKDKIQRINHSAKDQAEGLPGGVGQTWPGSRPGALREGVAAKAPDHLPSAYVVCHLKSLKVGLWDVQSMFK